MTTVLPVIESHIYDQFLPKLMTLCDLEPPLHSICQICFFSKANGTEVPAVRPILSATKM